MIKNFFLWICKFFTTPSIKKLQNEYEKPKLIDTKELEVELDIINQAKRYGEKNIPNNIDSTLSGPEASIINEVEKYRTKYSSWRDSRLNLQDKNLTDLVLSMDIELNKALSYPDLFAQDLNNLIDKNKPYLDELKRKFQQNKEELINFKQKNKLTRDAIIHKPSKKFFMIALLIFFIIFEAGLNSYFFAQGNDLGLLGGFIQAFTFAAINIALAALQGRFTIPFLFHNNIFYKTIGFICLIIAITLLLIIAMVVSHYRDAAVLDLNNPGQVAIDMLLKHQFYFNDTSSWILCGFTILFGIFAIWDGLNLNEHYPFYGAVFIKYENSRVEFETELELFKDELESKKQEALFRLDEFSDKLKLNLIQQDKIINDKVHTQSIYEKYMAQAEHTAKALLATFRTENQLYRTEKVPDYFSKEVELNNVELQAEYNINHDRENIDRCENRMKVFVDNVEEFKTKISMTFNEQYDHLVPLYS